MSITKHPSISASATEEHNTISGSAQQNSMKLLLRDLHDPDLIAKKNKALAELIQSWMEDEKSAEEQRETIEYLMRALDEDRLSDRKLFS